MTTTPPEHAFGAVPIFATLDPATRDELAAESRVRHYPEGQILCSEGDPGSELLVLEAGQVRVSRFSQGGQETVLAEVDAPTAFGELALIDGAPRAATLTATSDVRIRYLHREIVMGLLEREPAVAIAMMQSLTAMVRSANERLADMVSLDVPGRLAKWLLRHADQDGRVVLEQSQEELALAIGTTRVTVNRSLRRFERLGLIAVTGDDLRLQDARALQSISEG